MTTRYLLLVSSLLVLSLSANLTAQTELAADKETCFGMAGSLGVTEDATLFGASGEVTIHGRVGLAGGIGYADMNGNSATVSDIRVSGYPVKPARGSGKIGLLVRVGQEVQEVPRSERPTNLTAVTIAVLTYLGSLRNLSPI